MKYQLFTLLTALVPLASYAAPPVPKVSCELSWDLRDKSGASIKFDSAKPEAVVQGTTTKVPLKSFTLEADLKGGGAAGGSISWYELSIALKHGDYEAFRNDKAVVNQRHSLILLAGKERVVANCDISK